MYIAGNRLFDAKLTIRFLVSRYERPPGDVESIRPLLVKCGEYLIEAVCISYFPRLNRQSQRVRRGWENLFRLPYTVRIGRIIKNRDTAKVGNGFFEQLQTLPP